MALLRIIKFTNCNLAGWGLVLCVHSCKYIRLWYSELMEGAGGGGRPGTIQSESDNSYLYKS